MMFLQRFKTESEHKKQSIKDSLQQEKGSVKDAKSLSILNVRETIVRYAGSKDRARIEVIRGGQVIGNFRY